MKMPCVIALGFVAMFGQSSSPQIAGTTTTGVLLDVSVNDSKGQPVLDLQPSDFELVEDGVRQHLLSLTLVRVSNAGHKTSGDADRVDRHDEGRTDRGATRGAPSATAVFEASLPAVATAIVFGSLSAESRVAASMAARAYLSTLVPPQDYAGLFVIDSSLSTIEKFTNQPSKLLAALERLSRRAPASMRTDALNPASSPAAAGLDPKVPAAAGADTNVGFMGTAERQRRLEVVDPATGRVLTRDPTILLATLETRLEDGYQRFLGEYEGQTMLAALRGVIDALALLPCRKSVLLFAESLEIPSRQKANFDALIGRANSSNITVYSIDAAGLRVHSKDLEMAQQVNAAGAQGVGDERRANGAWTKELEQQEKLLSSKPSAALGRLAKDTGGFLIENTNNLSAGLVRMQRDRFTYYLLGYQPSNPPVDGSFRHVTVKVKRPKTSVIARPGYMASSGRD